MSNIFISFIASFLFLMIGCIFGFRIGYYKCVKEFKSINFKASFESPIIRKVISSLFKETLDNSVICIQDLQIQQVNISNGYCLEFRVLCPDNSVEVLGRLMSMSLSLRPESLILNYVDFINKFDGDKSESEEYKRISNLFINEILANVALIRYKHIIEKYNERN